MSVLVASAIMSMLYHLVFIFCSQLPSVLSHWSRDFISTKWSYSHVLFIMIELVNLVASQCAIPICQATVSYWLYQLPYW